MSGLSASLSGASGLGVTGHAGRGEVARIPKEPFVLPDAEREPQRPQSRSSVPEREPPRVVSSDDRRARRDEETTASERADSTEASSAEHNAPTERTQTQSGLVDLQERASSVEPGDETGVPEANGGTITVAPEANSEAAVAADTSFLAAAAEVPASPLAPDGSLPAVDTAAALGSAELSAQADAQVALANAPASASPAPPEADGVAGAQPDGITAEALARGAGSAALSGNGAELSATTSSATTSASASGSSGEAAKEAATVALSLATTAAGKVTDGQASGASSGTSDEADKQPGKAGDGASASGQGTVFEPSSAAANSASAASGGRNELVARLDQPLAQPAVKPQEFAAAPLPPQAEASLYTLPKAIPPSAVPIEIGLRSLQGLKEFQIRLDPAELGRVEVRLEISDDQKVSARVVVDRVETLHLLQREARTLERAFEQAGLKSSDAGIDISLRDQSQQGSQGRRDGSPRNADGTAIETKARNAVAIEPPVTHRTRTLHVGALDRSI